MKSNRQARRLLGVSTNPINEGFRISNRRWLVFSANYPHVWEYAKPSRQQRKATKAREAALQPTYYRQHTQGERE